MISLLCYHKCSNCKKLVKLMEEKKIDFQYREITEENPSLEELKEWTATSSLPLTRWMNTSGNLYREMGLAQKRKTMSEDEILALLATDGMLVKRPILLLEDRALVGKEVWDYVEGWD